MPVPREKEIVNWADNQKDLLITGAEGKGRVGSEILLKDE